MINQPQWSPKHDQSPNIKVFLTEKWQSIENDAICKNVSIQILILLLCFILRILQNMFLILNPLFSLSTCQYICVMFTVY